jgi:hypothetical protein
MKRIGVTLLSTVMFWLGSAGQALAQYPPPPPPGRRVPPPIPAITGADISLGMVLVAVLVVLGVAALLAARRKASSGTKS